MPPTNPYTGNDSARCDTGPTDPAKKCQEIFASGLRNPYRFAFDPNAPRHPLLRQRRRTGPLGGGRRGHRPGPTTGGTAAKVATTTPTIPAPPSCDQPPYTPPIHEYNHDTGCSAITGGAFVPDDVWPAAYDGSYLYGDFVCGKIFVLAPDGRGVSRRRS